MVREWKEHRASSESTFLYCRLTSSGCASKRRLRCSYGFSLKQDTTLREPMSAAHARAGGVRLAHR